MTMIYHITTLSAVQAARQSGDYRAESLASQGFIHFSQSHQLLGVANAFYANLTVLVILVVDPTLLSAELKFEAPAHPGTAYNAIASTSDQLFPHLYGPLNLSAISGVVDLPHVPGESFKIPDLI